MKLLAGTILAACIGALALTQAAVATPITGDPSADGWVSSGNSLSNGVYVRGSANYGYDTYSAGFTIQSGSALDITDAGDSSLSWLAGDTVLGAGGKFQPITASDAGWSGFTGGSVNGRLSGTTPGPKLQAKFGTADATWSTSTVVPHGGNGSSSSSDGGGRVQVRTSGWNSASEWSTDAGTLLTPSDSHIIWDGPVDPSEEVARLIWNWDVTNNLVASWEILLNVSLLERLTPSSYAGLFPAIGDMTILTVQDRSSDYTDALVQIARVDTSSTPVPAPDDLLLFAAALLGLGLVLRRRQRV